MTNLFTIRRIVGSSIIVSLLCYLFVVLYVGLLPDPHGIAKVKLTIWNPFILLQGSHIEETSNTEMGYISIGSDTPTSLTTFVNPITTHTVIPVSRFGVMNQTIVNDLIDYFTQDFLRVKLYETNTTRHLAVAAMIDRTNGTMFIYEQTSPINYLWISNNTFLFNIFNSSLIGSAITVHKWNTGFVLVSRNAVYYTNDPIDTIHVYSANPVYNTNVPGGLGLGPYSPLAIGLLNAGGCTSSIVANNTLAVVCGDSRLYIVDLLTRISLEYDFGVGPTNNVISGTGLIFDGASKSCWLLQGIDSLGKTVALNGTSVRPSLSYIDLPYPVDCARQTSDSIIWTLSNGVTDVYNLTAESHTQIQQLGGTTRYAIECEATQTLFYVYSQPISEFIYYPNGELARAYDKPSREIYAFHAGPPIPPPNGTPVT